MGRKVFEMATKNPIGNYGGRMEELDKPTFEGPKAKHPYKNLFWGAVGGTALTVASLIGIPDSDMPKQKLEKDAIVYAQKESKKWFADILKMAEAQENGKGVYINPRCMIMGDFDPYQNLEESIPLQLQAVLSEKGVKIVEYTNGSDGIVEVNLGLFFKKGDPLYMTNPGTPNDTVIATIKYKSGKTLKVKSLPKLDSRFQEDMIQTIGNDIVEYADKGSKGRTSMKTNPNEIVIDVGGEYVTVDKSKVRRASMSPKVLEGINSQDPEVSAYWKEWQKKEHIGFGLDDGQCYKVFQ